MCIGLWTLPSDLVTGGDVRLVEFFDDPVHGVLAAPPCTFFSIARNKLPTEAELLQSLAVVDACLRIILLARPKWWVLENPVGRLRRFIGPPALWFDPCDYGDPYTKKTGLWGKFVIPEKTPVEPVLKNYIRDMPGGNKKRARRRAVTPSGFAAAFFEANP